MSPTPNPDTLRTPTITDVAREAKVGKTSVSRYLNGEFDSLSDALRLRIQQAISTLGFRPNQMARGLKRGRTRMVGMVVADISNPYSVEVMRGVEAACQKQGFMLMVCNSDNQLELEKRYLDLLTNYRVEGLVINPIGLPEEDLASISNTGLPLVIIDRRAVRLQCDMVGLDNRQAATLAAQHLLQQGFQSIHFFTEPIGQVSSRSEREQALRQVVAAAGKGYSATTSELDMADTAGLALALQKALKSKKRTAIFAGNGRMLLNVALGLQQLGARWPEDIGLLGFDDPSWAALAGSGITGIRQPTFDIGHAALDFLVQRIDGIASPARMQAFPGELMIRGSTQPLKSVTEA
ncbi:LacI family DNA-binding transcriptional regulator [Collimonas humicola]|uniref:LacI family DNA-binding transcriptional regulator n=1 Tax=Collimonas humicola TaxID=2825886 RepID=UPI001B8C6318|nr:LacI family DNA-binding transcriptional regulator [Collimonas humicola]